MSLGTTLFGIIVILIIFTGILFVLFGQITVRKLRKKPEVKESLGASFVSGWDILNVGGALCRPRWLDARFKKSNFSWLAADSSIIKKHTTQFDRVLGRVFFISYCITVFITLTAVFLTSFEIID